MTELGMFLAKKSINKAEISRKTGITVGRMVNLTIDESTHLRAKELYLIALAIDVEPCELLEAIYKDVKLQVKE